MKTKLLTLALVLLTIPTLAFALSLDEAKSQGLVGELPSGYLAPVSDNPSPEVVALVDDINTKRRAAYKEIAAKNNTPVAAVEALAGTKAIEKTASGHFVKQDGKWLKKN